MPLPRCGMDGSFPPPTPPSLAEVYSDIVNPSFFAAFAWALLDSIADTSHHPPKLRPLREIECITTLESEAVRLLPLPLLLFNNFQ